MTRFWVCPIAFFLIGSGSLLAQDDPEGGAALPLLPISQVLSDANGDTIPDLLDERVRVRGVVTIPPGLLADKHFQAAIQDESGGLMLFEYELNIPLQRGDRVEAVGTVQQYRGAVQLKNNQIKLLGASELPEPERLSIAQAASWERLGQRVRLRGVLGPLKTGAFGSVPLTGDSGDVIVIFLPPRVLETFPLGRYPEGAFVELVGVMTLYKQSWPYDSGYQIILSDAEQISLLEKPPPAWLHWVPWVVLAFLLFSLLMLGAFYLHYRRQRERERELATLNELASALASPDFSQEQLSQRACDVITRYGLVDAVVVHLFDRRGQLTLAAASGMPRVLAQELVFGGCERVGNGALPDAQQLAHGITLQGYHLLSLLPLGGSVQPIGVLTAFSTGSPRETALQQRAMLAAARLLAMGLENMDVHMKAEADREELKQLAITDDLTSLYNRRFLDEYLRIQIAMANRRGSSLAFLAIDLDHFKQINDAHGHDAGDQVLVRVANVVRESSRASDLPVRVGGEEFLLVIADTDEGGASQFAERLRENIAHMRLADIEPGVIIKPTVSIGVAIYPRHGATVRNVLRACDRALYRAKREGRNRVAVASTGEASVS